MEAAITTRYVDESDRVLMVYHEQIDRECPTFRKVNHLEKRTQAVDLRLALSYENSSIK